MASRLLNLENELRTTKSMLDKLANILATSNTLGGGGGSKPFLTIEEQAQHYLKLSLSPEQIELVKGTRRDENASKLRGNIICELFKKGVSANQISIALNKDHNSIYYHLLLQYV